MPSPAILTKNILVYFATAVDTLKNPSYLTPVRMLLISGIPEPYADFDTKSHIPVAMFAVIMLKSKNFTMS